MSICSTTTVSNLTEARLRSRLPTWFPGGLVDQFIRKLPFHKMGRWTEKLVWNRAVAFSQIVSAAGPYAQDTTRSAVALDTSGSTNEGTFNRFGDFLEVDVHQDPELIREQIRAKEAAVVRSLGDQVLNGDGNAPNIQGFDYWCHADQKHQKSVPTLDDWDLLASLVTPSDGMVGAGPDCFVCHGQMWRHLMKLIRDAGLTPQFVDDEELGVPVLHYAGIPVYVGQNSQSEPTNVQSVWAIKLSGPTGVKLCHIGGESSDFGIRVEDLDRFTSNKAHRAKFVGGYFTLLVPEKESIARMYGISTTNGNLGLPDRVA